jgi:polar amino acid transport system substrate-binding protein
MRLQVRTLGLLCALLALSAVMAAQADEGKSVLTRIKEKGVIEVAVYENNPPYSYRDKGHTSGVDVDVARALAKQLGVSASLRLVGADETMEDDLRNNVWKGHYLGGGVADVMLRVPYDAEFGRMNDHVRLVAPYHREQIVVALDPKYGTREHALGVFTHEKVGVELDTLADFYLLSALNGRIRDNVVHFTNVRQATEALMKGEVAGVMAPRSELEAGLGARLGDFSVGPMQMTGMRESGWDVGAAVKAGYDDLGDAVDQAMQSLRKDGELQKIFKHYGLTYQLPSVLPVLSANNGEAK